MTTLLSDSERFWLGVLLARLAYVAETPGESAYLCLLHTATPFGVGAMARIDQCDGVSDDSLPNEIDWTWAGKPLSNNEFVSIQTAISATTEDICSDLSEDNVPERLSWFEQLSQFQLSSLLVGYSDETPNDLYTIKPDGSLKRLCRIMPHPPGLYRTLLRRLHPHLDLPPAERVAVGRDCDPNWRLPADWSGDPGDLYQPTGASDALKCVDESLALFFDDSDLPDDQEFLSGYLLATAEIAIRRLSDLTQPPLADEPCSRSDDTEQATTTIPPPQPRASHPDDEDATLGSDAFGLDRPDAITLHNPFTPDCVMTVMRAMKSFVRSASPSSSAAQDRRIGQCVKDATESLEHVRKWCHDRGIDGAMFMVDHALEDLLAFSRSMQLYPLAVFRSEHYGYRNELAESLKAALPWITQNAYGELRFRDTFDGAVRPAPDVREKVAESHRNVKATMEMAANALGHSSAYVPLALMAPVVEVAIRQIAEKRLMSSRTWALSEVLHQLRSHAEARDDVELRHVVKVGHAAISIRNRVTHKMGASYDSHDAQFLYHALCLLLRSS
jgi:hypothetical protein